MSDKITVKRAVQLASRKIHLQTDKRIEENLSHFCGSMAEAYRIGAEEAQRAIVSRFRAEVSP